MKLCSLVPNFYIRLSVSDIHYTVYSHDRSANEIQQSRPLLSYCTSLHKYFFYGMPDCPASSLLFTILLSCDVVLMCKYCSRYYIYENIDKKKTIAWGYQCCRSVLWILIRIRSNPELFWPGQIQIRNNFTGSGSKLFDIIICIMKKNWPTVFEQFHYVRLKFAYCLGAWFEGLDPDLERSKN